MDGWSVVIGVLGALAAVGSAVAVIIKSRSDGTSAKVSAKTALDARIDARVEAQLQAAWKRIDEVETAFRALESRETRRTGAITRILRAIAAQWPNGDHGPDLDPSDIVEIEETIPPSWMLKKPIV